MWYNKRKTLRNTNTKRKDNEMLIVTKPLSEIRPYEKNPRKNDDAVEYVANSIKEFGFKVPIVIDKVKQSLNRPLL